jgi:hypothetical protein
MSGSLDSSCHLNQGTRVGLRPYLGAASQMNSHNVIISPLYVSYIHPFKASNAELCGNTEREELEK